MSGGLPAEPTTGDLPAWHELPPGGVSEDAGATARKTTGYWRGGGQRPLLDLSLCVQCLHCWISCPDSCFILEDGKVAAIDYDHCKGCGICAQECPPMVNAIVLVEERRFSEEKGQRGNEPNFSTQRQHGGGPRLPPGRPPRLPGLSYYALD